VIPLRVVDAFARGPFTGNPAAVCLLSSAREAEWMQKVAMEMNLSETAFVARRADGDWDLRWFTPAVEVDLCGHATLASAHVLWEDGILAGDAAARFHTRSGLLSAIRVGGDQIELNFPVKTREPIERAPDLAPALGARVLELQKNEFDYLAVLESDEVVVGLRPDVRAIAKLGVRGVIVTAESSDPAFDFVSRFFAPGAGVDEDPVTGSAHCFLAPYWADRLGRTKLLGHQVSRRGGVVGVTLEGDRVRLAGKAVTTSRGELLV